VGEQGLAPARPAVPPAGLQAPAGLQERAGLQVRAGLRAPVPWE
jgi:hypothetical protein